MVPRSRDTRQCSNRSNSGKENKVLQHILCYLVFLWIFASALFQLRSENVQFSDLGRLKGFFSHRVSPKNNIHVHRIFMGFSMIFNFFKTSSTIQFVWGVTRGSPLMEPSWCLSDEHRGCSWSVGPGCGWCAAAPRCGLRSIWSVGSEFYQKHTLRMCQASKYQYLSVSISMYQYIIVYLISIIRYNQWISVNISDQFLFLSVPWVPRPTKGSKRPSRAAWVKSVPNFSLEATKIKINQYQSVSIDPLPYLLVSVGIC